ncbi:hypothetical protein PVAP13_9KG069620 [Panicum virgatum]|uniref:Uncharacterized protein n=1 Tax=Panicum virgatum TaxID=38727 RepID=A0A8T0NGD8_PANVG|nr:hypothetical protein PVAP13_9KG069620 [Panicum virgatum]
MTETRNGQNLTMPPLTVSGKPPEMLEKSTPKPMASSPLHLQRRTLEQQQCRETNPQLVGVIRVCTTASESADPHHLQRRLGHRRRGEPVGFGAGTTITLGSPFLL